MGKTAGEFSLTVCEGVATITLTRANRLNALTFSLYRALTEAFESLAQADDVGAIILTGAGRGFCSGGDRQDIIGKLQTRGADELLDFTRQTCRLVQSIRLCTRPVIAAMHGPAIGAGAVIAAACDLRVAAVDTRIGFVFPQVGLSGADMGAAYLLPQLVGLGHASELLLLGEIIDARRAHRIGLINRLADDRATAFAVANQWAQMLANGPRRAHATTKTMLRQEAQMNLEQALEMEARAQAECMGHSDFRDLALDARAKGA